MLWRTGAARPSYESHGHSSVMFPTKLGRSDYSSLGPLAVRAGGADLPPFQELLRLGVFASERAGGGQTSLVIARIAILEPAYSTVYA